MSGIAGIIDFDGAPVQPEWIKLMTSSMDYRGPDGISHWREEAVSLGHCLLQTTPESLQENQPVISEDGKLVMVMDGRVDNWLELRQQLLKTNCVLRDRSDSELILKAYLKWGENFVNHC